MYNTNIPLPTSEEILGHMYVADEKQAKIRLWSINSLPSSFNCLSVVFDLCDEIIGIKNSLNQHV